MPKFISIIPILFSLSCTTGTNSSLIDANIGSAITARLAMSSNSLSRQEQSELINAGAAIGVDAGYLELESKRVGFSSNSKLGKSTRQGHVACRLFHHQIYS